MHKRKTNKKHASRLIKLLDKLVVVMGVLNIFATLPQVYVVWIDKNAAGVSSLSWGYYSVFAIVFLLYGIVHKEIPIIASYTGSVVLFSAVLIGSLLY